jgi:hypothetical protein
MRNPAEKFIRLKRRGSRRPSYRGGQLAPHFPSLARLHETSPQLHMFTEDVRTGLMPYTRVEGSEKFSVSIGEDPAAIELMQSLAGRDPYSKEELVCAAVNDVGQRLSWHGRATYQIIADDSKSEIIRLRSCTPERLYRVPGFYIHHVPVADRKEFPSRFILVPKAQVWEVRIPDQLGGVNEYLRILTGLKRYKTSFPQFFVEDLRVEKTTLNFQSSEYIRYKKAVEARLTALWGWPSRDTSLDHETEYFHFYRTLTFRWAQAILRDHIIKELNDLFKRLNLNSEITLHGMPSPEFILDVRQQMTEGSISFVDAYEATSLFKLLQGG